MATFYSRGRYAHRAPDILLYHNSKETEMTQLKRVLDDIKVSFKEKLQAKTGWGKKEVYDEFMFAISEALLKELDREEIKLAMLESKEE